MMNYRICTYYTLADMLRYFEGNSLDIVSYKLGLPQENEVINLIQFMYDPIDPDPYETGCISKDETNKLWCEYFANGHLNSYIVRALDDKDPKEAYIDWMTDWIYVLNLTYNKYKKLIDLYKQEEDNLLNKLETNNIVKFNDTPQNSGDYEGDDFTSNITSSSTKSDSANMINRLSEIRALYDDIYTAWSNEFKHFFITSARYQDEQE